MIGYGFVGIRHSHKLFFFSHCATWLSGSIVPKPGSNSGPNSESMESYHWTAREFPTHDLLINTKSF